MTTTKEQAKIEIEKLVNRFESHLEEYKNSDYNETQTRRDFIDPLFKALGWDIDNEQDFAESYREVIHEAKQKVKEGKSEKTKAPDYAFRIGGKNIFFLEAKKPSVSIKDAVHPAYQVRRYGWSAKLSVSIITDFDEFSVYDCTKKPLPTDKATVARLKYINYKDYIKEFDFFWGTFSKESVLKGSFDKYVKSDTNKKGTATVDYEFLQSLDNWRTYLATSISWNNKDLGEEEINFAVQQTIDRIIFMRIAEDRSVELYGQLKTCITKGNYYQNLFEIFKKADEKYNSGLFDLKKDKTCAKLNIDNKVIKNIITELYYPDSPYEFSVLSVEILGSAYEQFLGKVIRITPSHHAKIEEKPEVRKAGGVYYTPQYIVEYIVKNTVGKLIDGKTPKEIEKIKIVDPACGSGSFLIGAYQFLLDFHKDYYSNNGKPSKGKKESTLTPDGNLTTSEKKKILINNIFGVDLDVNAVEVTKLSLLLKCMEGETDASINQQLKLWNERVLPTLENNIKNGNSLIDTDYYDCEIDFEDEKKIKPFNWQKAFPDISKKEGFDIVIGNPPWVSLNGKFGNDILNTQAQEYLINKYCGNTYMPNLYEYFVHKGLELINKDGVFSFIVPDRLGFNNQFVSLRKKILEKFKIDELLYKAPFPGIVTDTLIFRFSNKTKSGTDYKINVGEFGKVTQTKTKNEYLQDSECRFVYESSDKASKTLNKIFTNKSCKPLGEISETTSGFGGKSTEIFDSRKNQRQIEVIRGRSIQKYSSVKPYYFEFIRDNITGRTTDKKKLGVKEKVLLRKTGYPIIATYDESGIFPEQSLYFIFNNKTSNSLKYYTALINSKLFQFVYINSLVTNKDSTPQLKKVDLDKFPAFICDLKNKDEKAKHDEIVKNVDSLLKLNTDLQYEKLESNINMLKNRIEHCEEKIDKIINELYGVKDIEFEE